VSTSPDDALESNRAHWDALASVHGQDAFYDSAGLIAGRRDLPEAEAAAVAWAAPDLRGRDVVHIQCHIGFDTIALARRGARVTGVDFSRASLAKAADLAERCR
jgi:2-polyprenyl-3-methyl-5-hydroxy-6-metoxy-1,4-benzoquinol methylase